MAQIKVGILFGGKSAEHEVSLQSAKNVFDAIDKTRFDPVLIGINKSGEWLLENSPNDFLINSDDPKNIKLKTDCDHVVLLPAGRGKLYNLTHNKVQVSLDVIFPILHGPCGEDGTVQGLLKLADIPFVGCGVLGSAVGMDKGVMKSLLVNEGIPIGKYIVVNKVDDIPSYDLVKNKIGEPCFVKPANMGSSVGVEKIHNESEYKKFVEAAFKYDNKIILEEFIEGREIECAVLGNDEPLASLPGEVKPQVEFYSYSAKYLDDKAAIVEVPASLDEKSVKCVQSLAVKTFKALSASGLSRVDLFLKKDGSFLVNEINTMPGFTKISMYPKMWAACGISYSNLITKLIDLAFENYNKENAINTSYA
ncbi:MAG: D-alanine--D-alanine ligase [Termitinemataceae bacterium]|nr:MAG: D-alanine--D-alanine ligase [Termitinemataceae bacterium]